jgi:hypothetical protein
LADEAVGIREIFQSVFGQRRLWSDGTPKEWAQTQALFENRLNWWKDWEDSPAPIAWLRSCAQRIHHREEVSGGRIRQTDALYQSFGNDREVIALEQISDMAGIGEAVPPRQTTGLISRIEAHIREDEELREYAALRHAGWKRYLAWEHLGWDEKLGEAVDRRYRRLRSRLAASGFEYAPPEIAIPPGFSAASCTVVMERLRVAVPPGSEATLSGRVVYQPILPEDIRD